MRCKNVKSCSGLFWLYLLGSSDVFCKLLGAEGKVGKHWFVQIFVLIIWLNICTWARWSESFAISTCNYLPSWARWIYLSLVDPTKKLFFGHVMNPSLNKRVSVSKAEYWPRSLLRFYCSWCRVGLQKRKTKLIIQRFRPHAWSIS